MMTKSLLTREHWGSLVSALVLALALTGALITGSQIGHINGLVEGLSSVSSTWIGEISTALPLGSAFAAGMVAAVNPCGFAVLPAYLAMYASTDEPTRAAPRLLPRLGRAAKISTAMTLGFVAVFGAAGILVSAASALITPLLTWIGLAVGIGLVVMGGRMLGGVVIYHNLGERIAGRLGASSQARDPRGYFAYGLAYAATSLSCALPIFLWVVASALTADGVVSAAAQLLLYALGMGTVIAILTGSIALVEHEAVRRVRGLVRYMEPVSAVLLLLAGGYIVYYWLTLGRILAVLGLVAR